VNTITERLPFRPSVRLASCVLVLSAVSHALGEENLARTSRLLPARSLSGAPYSIANVIDGRVTTNEESRPASRAGPEMPRISGMSRSISWSTSAGPASSTGSW